MATTACGDTNADSQGPQAPDTTTSMVGKEPAFGLEVWIPYRHAGHAQLQGLRPMASMEKDRVAVRQVADDLHRAVREGTILLEEAARKMSAMPGGWIGGYTGPLTTRGGHAMVQQRARLLVAAEVGQLTDIHEVNGGWWFARRIDLQHAQRLQARMKDAKEGLRAKALVLNLHFARAQPHREEFDQFPRGHALEHARRLIARVKDGEDLGDLAAKRANDDLLRKRRGLFYDRNEKNEIETWISWTSRWVPYRMLVALLEDAPVGRVMDAPLDTPGGVMVIQVLERARDTGG